MKKRFFWVATIVLIGLFIYGLIPLSSDKYTIEFNQNAIDSKKAYLETLEEGTDSITPPNIIVILADDLGKTDISLYGSPFIETPNIDNIGKEGVVFSEGYTTSSICSPSRASLLTGRYQQRFGMEFQLHERYLRNRLEYFGFKYFVDSDPWRPIYMTEVPGEEDIKNQGLPPDEITFADLAKSKGYKTALIGKWHLGSQSIFSPNNFGFDYFFGFKSSHHLYALEDDPDIVNQRIEEDWTDQYIWDCVGLADCNLYRNEEVVPQEGYLTEVFGQEAVRFIEENKEDPFLLFVPFNAPHTPLQAPRSYVEKFAHIEDPIKRVYLAMIASLDDEVGRITSKVNDLGLSQNTLIIFLSDNGGATYAKVTDNAPLRGGKLTQFEGGVNVPMMMQWDGVIEPGSKFFFPSSSLDVFSTIAGIINAELPGGKKIDGVNLIPYLTKQVSGPPHEAIYWQKGYNKAIRSDQWKVIYNEKSKKTMVFNMAADKFEERDFAENQSDLANQLLQLHNGWSSELMQPLWPAMIEFRYKEGETFYEFVN